MSFKLKSTEKLAQSWTEYVLLSIIELDKLLLLTWQKRKMVAVIFA